MKTNDTYPVKLTIYYTGQKERFKTNFEFSLGDWDKLNGDKLRDDKLKQQKRKINALIKDAEEMIEKIIPFSFEEFRQQFFYKPAKEKTKDLFELFDEYILLLDTQDRIGSATAYKTAKNALMKFNPRLTLKSLTTEVLEQFEQYLKAKGNSSSTVGIYMRHLRAIVNIAIKKELLLPNKYPFKNYIIPASRNIKKALSREDLKKILDFTTNDPRQEMACDYWILSFLCNGMNMADICRLKQHNFTGDMIYFYRVKTLHTKKHNLRPIKVYLNPRAKTIIEKYKVEPVLKDAFLFAILEEGLSAKTIKSRISAFIKEINKQMKVIGYSLEIKVPVRTYECRHSFSTLLKRKGVDSMYIKEALGHSSLAVTENYLDDFEDERKIEYANTLTDL